MILRLSIRHRLLGLSLTGLTFVVLLGAVGYGATGKLSAARDNITANVSALKAQMSADMMHDALRGDVLRAMLAGLRKDAAAEQDVVKDLSEHGQTFRDELKVLVASPLSDEARQITVRLAPALDAYLAGATEVVGLAWKDTAAADAKLPAFQQSFEVLEKEMSALDELLEASAKSVRDDSEAVTLRARQLIIASALAAAFVLFVVGIWIGRSVTRPLASAARLARAVAEGDLRTRIEAEGNDEIGALTRAMAMMNDNLARVVGSVRDSSDSIATGTAEIVSGNTDLCQRTERQAASVQQTASSMSEITDTVKNSADSARQAHVLAANASQAASQGGEVIGRVVATMGQISQSSGRIADIIGVIDSIAFQTNILALNAAVEAARAGEQGRGFAVVASEVRALAQRSAGAAREIKALIGTSVEQVEVGSRLVGDAGNSIADIVGQVRRVSDLLAEISQTTQAQSGGIAQVNQAVGEIDRTTQQNAAVVEQTAAAAESLQQQARALVDAVSGFKLAAA
jgi:methyl-accepting chemotaxis protein